MKCTHAICSAIALLLGLGIAAVPAKAQAPGIEELRNAVIQGILETPVRLDKGQWLGTPHVEGGASRPRIGLIEDLVITGDLDGDREEETAALLWFASGGSGTMNYVAVMDRSDGKAVNRATVLLGDRVQIRGGRIDDGKLLIDVVQSSEDDPACCPSQLITRCWSFAGEHLVEDPPEVTGRLSPAVLADRIWVLSELRWNDPLPTDAPQVTLTFDQGRFVGTSGCNRYFAAVRAGDLPGDLSIGPIGGTKMSCPGTAGQIEHQYLSALAAASKLSFLAGRLALTWQDGDHLSVMRFRPR